MYDKPFRTIEQQLSLLRSRNIIIDDENFAYEALESISYYNIVNGYKNTFLSFNQTDKFKPNTTFNLLYTLHFIDISLSSVLMKYILLIEKSLKTKLSYIVAKELGVSTNLYLDQKKYSTSKNLKHRQNILDSLEKASINPKSGSPTHYYLNKKNHIPPWILSGDITFGLTIKWYDILKDNHKTFICNRFLRGSNITLSVEEKKEFFIAALKLLKEYRNDSAHGKRTFGNNYIIKLPKKQITTLFNENIISESEYNSNLGQSDLYAVLLSIMILINDKYILANFLEDIKSVLEVYSNLKFLGKSIFYILETPEDLLTRLQSAIEYRISTL